MAPKGNHYQKNRHLKLDTKFCPTDNYITLTHVDSPNLYSFFSIILSLQELRTAVKQYHESKGMID
jgi:hypothetical protein